MVWPLIWVQILALRAYVRATWGKGTKYHWSVTPYGRVFIRSIDWVPGQTEAPVWLKPALHENKRIAAALDGSLLTPDYVRLQSLLPREKRLGMRGRGVSTGAGLAAIPLPLTPAPLPGERGLPLPDS
jgi:hypothetical protein